MASYISAQPAPQLTQADIESLLAPAPVQESANAGVTLAEIKDLFKTMTEQNNNGSHSNRNTRKPPSQGTDNQGKPITYCWTHGITQNLHHASHNCTRKTEGHRNDATLNNRLGEVMSVTGLVFAQDPTVPLQIILPIEKEGALKSKMNYEIK
jgi:hypothetical protein